MAVKELIIFPALNNQPIEQLSRGFYCRWRELVCHIQEKTLLGGGGGERGGKEE